MKKSCVLFILIPFLDFFLKKDEQMKTNRLIAEKILSFADSLIAESDYVYDPTHQNRPHGGGTWYKTEKGWTTHKPEHLNHDQTNHPMALLPSYHHVDHVQFHDGIKAAKESNSPEKRWRVDVHEADDYKDCKTFMTESGSTIAIKPDGDIISVCKKANTTDRGSDLLKIAAANGGVKLDSFEGNHDFYTRNGFKPVSWTEFNKEYAPEGWMEGRDKEERIIFYKYIGKPYTDMTLNEFLASVPPKDYDEAAKDRDKEIENETK